MTEQPAEQPAEQPEEIEKIPVDEARYPKLRADGYRLATAIISARNDRTIVDRIVQDACNDYMPLHDLEESAALIKMFGMALKYIAMYMKAAAYGIDNLGGEGSFDHAFRAGLDYDVLLGDD